MKLKGTYDTNLQRASFDPFFMDGWMDGWTDLFSSIPASVLFADKRCFNLGIMDRKYDK